MMHHYAVYEAATGAVLRRGSSTNRRQRVLERRALKPGEAIYCLGPIDPETTYLPGGVPSPKPVQPVIIAPSEVKAHAGRILSYTDWLEIRAISGTPMAPEMADYRQAVRDRSGEIEAMDPIPADFRDASYWPVAP